MDERDDFLTFYDQDGQPFQISREDWVNEILPDTLQQVWDDPDSLHSALMLAVEDGFADHVLPAAERLFSIDPDEERSSVMLAIVYTEQGKPEISESLLKSFLQRNGASALALVNLSKILAMQGRDDEAEQTLRDGLDLNPNLESAVAWYAEMLGERGGEAAYEAALLDYAKRPEAWTPNLFLARYYLGNGRVEDAVLIYRDVLPRHPVDTALLMATGDLGTSGHPEVALDLVLPLYDVDEHEPLVGLNLLRAMEESGRLHEGRDLIDRLQRFDRPDVHNHLAYFEATLSQQLARPVPDQVSVSLGVIPGPIWARGLEDPTWVEPIKDEGVPVIGFLPLADESRHESSSPKHELEQFSGRMTRALPMYLVEASVFRTHSRPFFVIAVGNETAPVVTSTPWDTAEIIEKMPPDHRPDYMVNGSLITDDTGSYVELFIWDVETEAEITRFRVPCAEDFSGIALSVQEALLEAFQSTGIIEVEPESMGVFLEPPVELQDNYLLALSQLLVQVGCANGMMDREGMYNERGMYQSYFRLADYMSGTAELMAASGILSGLSYESPIAPQYIERLIELLQREEDPYYIGRLLLPLVLQRIGRFEEAASAAAFQRLTIEDDRYQSWLDRIG